MIGPYLKARDRQRSTFCWCSLFFGHLSVLVCPAYKPRCVHDRNSFSHIRSVSKMDCSNHTIWFIFWARRWLAIGAIFSPWNRLLLWCLLLLSIPSMFIRALFNGPTFFFCLKFLQCFAVLIVFSLSIFSSAMDSRSTFLDFQPRKCCTCLRCLPALVLCSFRTF